MFFRAIDENGLYRSKLVINNACEFWKNDSYKKQILASGVFAGRTIEECVYHEIGHVLTYQSCKTYSDFNTLEKKTRLMKRFGVSKYADQSIDGAETIAEAFVLHLRGKTLQPDVEKMLAQYTEVWRK